MKGSSSYFCGIEHEALEENHLGLLALLLPDFCWISIGLSESNLSAIPAGWTSPAILIWTAGGTKILFHNSMASENSRPPSGTAKRCLWMDTQWLDPYPNTTVCLKMGYPKWFVQALSLSNSWIEHKLNGKSWQIHTYIYIYIYILWYIYIYIYTPSDNQTWLAGKFTI